MSNINPQIIPMLSYEDGIAAMDWLCNAFGFSERSRMIDDQGRLSHGELVFDQGMIMLASPTPDYQSPKRHRQECKAAAKWSEVPYIINGILIFVNDLDSHYRRAKEYGATILSDIERGGPGDRYRTEDLEGHRWMFMQKSE